MTYTWLEGSEITQLDELCQERGWSLLNPLTTRALIAKNEAGEIVGVHVLQLLPHAEPLFVRREYRGQGIAEELSDRMFTFLTEMKTGTWFAVTDSPFAERICQKQGWKRVENPVYVHSGVA